MTDPPGHFVENLVVFGRVLRRLGFEIPVGRILELTEALTYVDLNVRDEVFHTCRALLVQRHEQLARFEDAFDAFWRDHSNPFAMQGTNVGDARTSVARASMSSGLLTPEGGATDEGTGDEAPEGVVQTWSEIGGLAHKDFAEFSPEEMARARLALDRLEWIPGERRTRRWVRGRGPRIDLRRALMRSLRSGGEVVVLPTRRRRTKPRPLVLLCDVSGSMERYSRMLLHFAHGLAHRHGRLEVFLFATGLTRVGERGVQDARSRMVGKRFLGDPHCPEGPSLARGSDLHPRRDDAVGIGGAKIVEPAVHFRQR